MGLGPKGAHSVGKGSPRRWKESPHKLEKEAHKVGRIADMNQVKCKTRDRPYLVMDSLKLKLSKFKDGWTSLCKHDYIDSNRSKPTPIIKDKLSLTKKEDCLDNSYSILPPNG